MPLYASNVKAARTERTDVLNPWTVHMRSKIMFFSVSAFIVLADQISKKFFESFLLSVEGHSVRAVGEKFARFTLAYNEGIAFSIPMGGRYVLSTISIIASLVIVFLIIKTPVSKRVELWGYSFILGGAVGNLIDRVMYGRVIDFIDCDFFDFIMERWPIFNFADSFITAGMGFLIFHFIFLEKKSEKIPD